MLLLFFSYFGMCLNYVYLTHMALNGKRSGNHVFYVGSYTNKKDINASNIRNLAILDSQKEIYMQKRNRRKRIIYVCLVHLAVLLPTLTLYMYVICI